MKTRKREFLAPLICFGIIITLIAPDIIINGNKATLTDSSFGKRKIGMEGNVTPLVIIDPNSKLIRTLTGHSSTIWSVVFHPNGRMLASASADNTVKLWNASTGSLIRNLMGHTSAVYCLDFSPSGDVLASGSFDRSILLWNVSSGQIIENLTGHTASVWSVSFNSAGTLLASGSSDNNIKVWDIQSGKTIANITGHTDSVRTVAFSSSDILASGSYDNSIIIWDISNQTPIHTIENHSDGVTSIDFHPQDPLLVSGSFDRGVYLNDVNTGELILNLTSHTGWVRTVKFSPDGMLLASGGSDRSLLFWNTYPAPSQPKGELIGNLTGHESPVLSISFNSLGNSLASASADSTIRIWNITDLDSDGMPNHWEQENGLFPGDPLDRLEDPDNDQLPNLLEYQFGTSPSSADSDSDLMPDGYEYENGLNGSVQDSNDDPDNDGLTNLQEFRSSTNPHDPDSDDDGWNDNIEIIWGTNPNDKASNPPILIVTLTMAFAVLVGASYTIVRYMPQIRSKLSTAGKTLRGSLSPRSTTWMSDLKSGKAIPIKQLADTIGKKPLDIPKFAKATIEKEIFIDKRLVIRSQMLLLSPLPPKDVTCQVCLTEITERHYFQCLECKRYICISDYVDLQNVGRTGCPNCSGRLQAFPFTCSACNLDFGSVEELTRQERCPLCGYTLPSQSMIVTSITKGIKASIQADISRESIDDGKKA
ncbi:MAG: hypothetical protein ACFFFG_05630 [Candidatus Thorarchaeota archaeon]